MLVLMNRNGLLVQTMVIWFKNAHVIMIIYLHVNIICKLEGKQNVLIMCTRFSTKYYKSHIHSVRKILGH
jgi:hypothetical protein